MTLRKKRSHWLLRREEDPEAENGGGLETAEEDLEVESEGVQGAKDGKDHFLEAEVSANDPEVVGDEDLRAEITDDPDLEKGVLKE